ncbi:monocarboxylate transporter 2-like isoform X3 [Vespula squamosa]|uniref:Monocarboxylate transporter 2-like isoform X3 n=1 Tax=Vespula squamosa TaxID=30214 RepID=A0ABD2BA07_VESSQ
MLREFPWKEEEEEEEEEEEKEEGLRTRSSKEGVVPVMSISRARSWPLLDAEEKRNCRDDDENHKRKKQNNEEEKKKEKKEEEKEEEEKNREKISDKKNERPNAGSPQVQARRLMCRHYYPEGGWGWVVTVVGTLVHLLGPGLQLSVPATLAIPATVKFYHHPLHTAGISYLDLFNLL